MIARDRCPLCGSRKIRVHSFNPRLRACDGCGETLYPRELVRRATKRTRLAYNVANNKEPGYR